MCVTADEVRVFSRLSYTDLGYDTESEFEAYINELTPPAPGLLDQFCNVPKGFFQSWRPQRKQCLF